MSRTIRTEDYVKAIYLAERKKGYARIVEISTMLEIKPPSVTEMIQKLVKKKLVKHERYGRIKLTRKGRKLARDVFKRHTVLKNFLMILGVNEKLADKDACKMEHDLSPETLEVLTKFVEFIQKAPKSPKWIKHFKYFLEKGKHPPCEPKI